MRAHAARQRDGEFITRDVGAPSRGWFPPNKKSDDGARQPAAPIFVLYPRRRGSRAPVPYRRGGRDRGRRTRPPCPEDPRAWCATACATRPRYTARHGGAGRTGRGVDFLCGVEIRRSLTGRQMESCRQWAFGGRWICLAALGRNGTARPGHYYFRSIAARGWQVFFNSRSPTCPLGCLCLAPASRMIYVGQFLLGGKVRTISFH